MEGMAASSVPTMDLTEVPATVPGEVTNEATVAPKTRKKRSPNKVKCGHSGCDRTFGGPRANAARGAHIYQAHTAHAKRQGSRKVAIKAALAAGPKVSSINDRVNLLSLFTEYEKLSVPAQGVFKSLIA